MGSSSSFITPIIGRKLRRRRKYTQNEGKEMATTTSLSSKKDADNNNDAIVVDVGRQLLSPSSSPPPSSSLLLGFLGNVGGMVDFDFFGRTPEWVNLNLPAGMTSQLSNNMEMPRIWSTLTGHSILMSPNLVWLAISAAVYWLFPYPIYYESGNSGGVSGNRITISPDWYCRRAGLNIALVLAYYGFWHWALYFARWANRPFVVAHSSSSSSSSSSKMKKEGGGGGGGGSRYKYSKTVHNVWYCLLGCLQWTAWEFVMVHLYADGRIGYQQHSTVGTTTSSSSAAAATTTISSGIFAANSTALPKKEEVLKFFLATIFVPVFRVVHFFFVHRLLHLRCFYKYIHALHHRNSDVEPFSGLCMSPAEHLYYISSIAPSVYWHSSPFQFLWNGMHLLLSPGASHSGYEDHWHSDQFHAAHHRYFECNYGSPDTPLDRWFGTFRESLAPRTKAYRGKAVECISTTSNSRSISRREGDDGTANASILLRARDDSKATLWGVPSWDHVLYYGFTALGLPLFTGWYVSTQRDNNNNSSSSSSSSSSNEAATTMTIPASWAALIVSVGPLILAALLSVMTANPSSLSSWTKLRHTMLYPQHEEPLIGGFTISLVMGLLLSILPTYHFFHSLFVQDPMDTAYNCIWGAVITST